MVTVEQVMAALESKGSEQTRGTYTRHGIAIPMFGVKVADLKTIAKRIKGNQTLALELYETGNYDAMYLAGIVADGSRMSMKQLQKWAKGAACETLSAYTVPGVAIANPQARDLAIEWINSKNGAIAVSGWGTYAGIVATTSDDALDLDEIKELLDRVVREIDLAPDRVRYMMNAFVIAVGAHVEPLLKHAKKTAKAIGEVAVDMGETACKVPQALEAIEKIETMGRVGKKRKTLKC